MHKTYFYLSRNLPLVNPQSHNPSIYPLVNRFPISEMASVNSRASRLVAQHQLFFTVSARLGFCADTLPVCFAGTCELSVHGTSGSFRKPLICERMCIYGGHFPLLVTSTTASVSILMGEDTSGGIFSYVSSTYENKTPGLPRALMGSAEQRGLMGGGEQFGPLRSRELRNVATSGKWRWIALVLNSQAGIFFSKSRSQVRSN